jgi:hypothetical protein
VHGDADRHAALVDLLSAPEVTWFGIEMLDMTMQDELAVFVKGEKGTAAYAQAESALLAYYESNWDDKFGGDEPPRENHYFKLLEMARDGHKAAYALDTDLEYTFFRYGEFPLGATTRNIVWAEQMPGEGRGLVFGGSAHMSPGPPGNVQQFVRDMHPGTAIYHYYVDHAP